MTLPYSAKGWLIVGAVVAAVEGLAEEGETLSEGCDRALEHKLGRILVPFAVIQCALHLLNILPSRIDLIHLGFSGIRAMLNSGKMDE